MGLHCGCQSEFSIWSSWKKGRRIFLDSLILQCLVAWVPKELAESANFSISLKKMMSAICCAAAAAKSLQSCPTLCDPTDGSPRGSPIPGILQARTLEWVAISFSNAGKWKVKVKLLSLVWLLATPWTAAHQAPPSMGFSRQECWSGVPLPSPICCVKAPKQRW